MANPAANIKNAAFLEEIPMEVVIELGRLRMRIRELASLAEDDVLELDQPVDQPLDLVVGGKKLAQGELVMVGDRVALRITEVSGHGETE